MKNVRNMTYSALMAALLVVCGWIAIPIPPVSFTLQTFGVLTALGVLGGKWGSISVILYLAMGLVGLPVFSGFSGGFSLLLGPTGGFLMAFPVMAWLCARFSGAARRAKILAGLAGLLIVYLLGAAGLAWSAGMSWFQALAVGALPFVWKDALSIVGAEWLAAVLKKRGLLR